MPFIGRGSTGQSGGAPSGGQYGGRYGGRGPSTAGLPSGRSSASGAAAAEDGLTAEYAIECAGESQPRWDACNGMRGVMHDLMLTMYTVSPHARCHMHGATHGTMRCTCTA